MQAELEAGAPIESFNTELESMLELTGGSSEIGIIGNQRLSTIREKKKPRQEIEEEYKGEQDSEIFYECSSTNEGLADAATFEDV